MDDFMRNHSQYSMIEGNTYFKGSGSCNDIDLIRNFGYENLTILENLNMAANDYKIGDFMRNHSCYSMIEGYTCFKS